MNKNKKSKAINVMPQKNYLRINFHTYLSQ